MGRSPSGPAALTYCNLAHGDAAALDGDDEYSRLRAAASVFVELQEEEEHSFKSLLEKEVL